MQIKSQLVLTLLSVMSGSLFLTSCKKDNFSAENQVNAVSTSTFSKDKNEKGTEFYALTSGNELVKYTTGRPLQELGSMPITNLPSGDSILAIDFRPATGQLYGVSKMSRIYIINLQSGRATVIGTGPFSPALNSTNVGMDFNPTVDRIRLVTDNEQNLRIHPETGVLAGLDGNINPGNPAVNAVAYTNSFAGATTTTLYDIDVASNKLYIQTPPNAGTLVLVGSLGVEASREGGFDISPDNSLALALLYGRGEEEGGQEESPGNKYWFYYINLQTGEATNAGKVEREIIGLAIPTRPVAYAVRQVTGQPNELLIFNPEQPSSLITRTITGLQAGETILGIDMRPVTGQLYALGSTSRIYTINTPNGAATAVSATPFSPALNGTSFGFDFNPTVDRIRVVSDNGKNFRLHPMTGALAGSDMDISPSGISIAGSAYTNNFPGTTQTTLYGIDIAGDQLVLQGGINGVPSPNGGATTPVGPLGVDVAGENGFDIGGASGKAYAILSSGSTTKLYTINLMTGAANAGVAFPSKVNGFAVGLGF